MDTLWQPALFRYFVQFLPLTTLIAARGVSKKWRALTLTTSLHPARKALLDVYLAAVVHPNFRSLVETLRPNVREFDREAYVADLKSRGCVLPDVFELWVLEWPPKAVYFWAWPGLERLRGMHAHYYSGNVLASSERDSEPTIDVVPVPKKDVETAGGRKCRGLAMYEVYGGEGVALCQLWLVVDPNERINDRHAGGRLIWTIAPCTSYLDDGDCVYGEKRTFRDRTPFGPPADADFKMVDFLSSLDFTRDQISSYVVYGFYYGGLPPMEEAGE